MKSHPTEYSNEGSSLTFPNLARLRTAGIATIVYWLVVAWRRSVWFKPLIIGVCMCLVVMAAHVGFVDYVEITSYGEQLFFAFVLKWTSVLVIAISVTGWIRHRTKSHPNTVNRSKR